MRSTFTLLCFLLLSAFSVGAQATDYAAQIDQLRAERIVRLTKPDGWLTLIGLHFLKPGINRVGHAPDNDIVLAAGPAHFGTINLRLDGKAHFEAADGVATQIDGRSATNVDLVQEAEKQKPTLVATDSVSFFLLERGGKPALRVKDSAAPRRQHFSGIHYFPTDPSWRIEANWVPFDKPQDTPITNIIGHTSQEKAPGKAIFTLQGQTYELTPIIEEPGEPLFFIFSDATSGKDTYHMRFLYAQPSPDGKIVLDFNLAYNPPCAFTPFATCPLPPKSNQLTLAITAGEKVYQPPTAED